MFQTCSTLRKSPATSNVLLNCFQFPTGLFIQKVCCFQRVNNFNYSSLIQFPTRLLELAFAGAMGWHFGIARYLRWNNTQLVRLLSVPEKL